MRRATLQIVSRRCFQARVIAKPAIPPGCRVKEAFDYSEIEPVKDMEQSVSDDGVVFTKTAPLFHHFENQEYYRRNGDVQSGDSFYTLYAGMFGPYWPAHYGGGYLKYLKRRTTKPGVYPQKNPIARWWRRKCDEHGWHCDFPRGQDYQIACKWFLMAILGAIAWGQLLNFKKHFALKQPPKPKDPYPPRINLPFYLYIVHSIPAPGVEDKEEEVFE